MMHILSPRFRQAGAVCLACMLLPAAALGAPEPAKPAPAAVGASSAPAGWPGPANPERLAGQRGGADTVTTQATLNATVADNSARNVVTGNNVIDNGAFSNMTGLPMVIQNTGANVLIQSSTVINLQMR